MEERKQKLISGHVLNMSCLKDLFRTFSPRKEPAILNYFFFSNSRFQFKHVTHFRNWVLEEPLSRRKSWLDKWISDIYSPYISFFFFFKGNRLQKRGKMKDGSFKKWTKKKERFPMTSSKLKEIASFRMLIPLPQISFNMSN